MQISSQAAPYRQIIAPTELFVGNLSFFCQESDLHALFSMYAHVESARVIVNDSRQRSLMFGFVVVATEREARQVEKLLDNHLFMGRRLKIKVTSDGVSRQKVHPTERAMADGVQLHVAISSQFPTDRVIFPTECVLRRELQSFGFIVDAVVKQYTCQDRFQVGYGFVVFEDEASASQAVRAGTLSIANGITLIASWPRQLPQPARRFSPTTHTPHTHIHTPQPSLDAFNPFSLTHTDNGGCPELFGERDRESSSGSVPSWEARERERDDWPSAPLSLSLPGKPFKTNHTALSHNNNNNPLSSLTHNSLTQQQQALFGENSLSLWDSTRGPEEVSLFAAPNNPQPFASLSFHDEAASWKF